MWMKFEDESMLSLNIQKLNFVQFRRILVRFQPIQLELKFFRPPTLTFHAFKLKFKPFGVDFFQQLFQ